MLFLILYIYIYIYFLINIKKSRDSRDSRDKPRNTGGLVSLLWIFLFTKVGTSRDK